MKIRREGQADDAAIRAVTVAAFQGSAYGYNGEAEIVDVLRVDGALTLSLVAEDGGQIVGHIALSPVQITSSEGDWYGLGPISVAPGRQRQGVGAGLVHEGLRAIRDLGASGCVVLGDPRYYSRFGFESDPAICYRPQASPYLQRLVLRGSAPSGEVRYHSAFGS